MTTSFNRPLTPADEQPAVPQAPAQEPVVTPPVEETVSQSEDVDWDAIIEKEKQEKDAIKAQQLMQEAAGIQTPPAPKQEPEQPAAQPDDGKKSKAKDASNIIFTDNGTREEMMALFEKMQEEDTRPEEIKEEDPKQEIINLAFCNTLGMRNKQQQLLTKLINALDKNTEEVSKLKAGIKELGLSKIKPNISASGGPKVLSGDAALATVVARTKGVFRIPLYNSGFWLSIKPPTVSELDAFVREVDNDFKEFGRILGAHYHLIFNIYIKKKLVDLIFNNLIGSNFDNFKNKQALLDVISLNDYDTLAWALCTMMYIDGINIGVYCTNIDCGYVDKSQYIDLSKCNFLNHDVFNADAVKWMLSGFTEKTPKNYKDLEHYRINILKGTKTIKDIDGTNVYTLEVPTMRRYLEIGEELLDNIIESVHGERDTSTQRLSTEISYNVYKMLTPWISKMTMLENGVTQFITSDSNAIMESLDIGYGEDNNIYAEVESFLKDSRVCYFGITSLKCPKCGKIPNLAKDNMFVFDMEHLFFGLSYLRLGRIGTTSLPD